MARGGARKNAGRPLGKISQAKRTLADMAQTHGEQALQTLVEIATDGDAPHSARVSAANALLDRGYGRPPQSLEHTGKDGEPIRTQAVPTIIVGTPYGEDEGEGD